MTKKIKKLEKETIIWRTKWEKNNKALLQMAEEVSGFPQGGCDLSSGWGNATLGHCCHSWGLARAGQRGVVCAICPVKS